MKLGHQYVASFFGSERLPKRRGTAGAICMNFAISTITNSHMTGIVN
jgi:hypothetical protein